MGGSEKLPQLYPENCCYFSQTVAPNSSSVDFERLRAVGAQCAAGRCQVLLADNSVKSLKVENLREAEAIGAKMISRHQLYINIHQYHDDTIRF